MFLIPLEVPNRFNERIILLISQVLSSVNVIYHTNNIIKKLYLGNQRVKKSKSQA